MDLTEQIGKERADAIARDCYMEFDPTETIGGALDALVGVTVEAQLDEPSDDFAAIAEFFGATDIGVAFDRIRDDYRDRLAGPGRKLAEEALRELQVVHDWLHDAGDDVVSEDGALNSLAIAMEILEGIN